MRYAERLWSLKYTIGLLVVLQAFDTLSTILALGVGGGEEANPVARRLLEGDAVGLVLAKWGVVGLVFLAPLVDPRDTRTDYVKAALVIMNCVYAVVLSSNFAAYGLATGDWMLPVAFWALVLALGIVAVDEAFFRPRATTVQDRS